MFCVCAANYGDVEDDDYSDDDDDDDDILSNFNEDPDLDSVRCALCHSRNERIGENLER